MPTPASGTATRHSVGGAMTAPMAHAAEAIHIHSVGTCEDPDKGFVASKGHLNPDDRKHGLMNPEGPDAGDL